MMIDLLYWWLKFIMLHVQMQRPMQAIKNSKQMFAWMIGT